MNLAVVIRRALIDCNVVKQNETTPAIITQPDLVSWAQDATREMEALWRKSKEDQNLIHRLSTDSSFTFEGETYAPSTFQMTTDAITGRTYQMPPDLIQIKTIRVIESSFRHFVFTAMDIAHPVFRGYENVDNPAGAEIFYDLIGRRELRLSHPLPGTAEIELGYIAQLPSLYIYSVGSANCTLDSTDVTLSTATLLTERLTLPAVIYFNRDGATDQPLIVGQTAASSTVHYINPNETNIGQARQIESFDDATGLTLEATWPFTTDTAIGYTIVSAPWAYEDHYPVLIHYVRHMIYSRIGNRPAAKVQFDLWEHGKKKFEYDIIGRAQDVDFVIDFEG